MTEGHESIFQGVKSKAEIIEELAKNRMVETMVTNIAHQPMSADLEDLSQMVYLILLEYDERKLQDLYENEQMHFFVARIIINQYNSVNSPFYAIFRKFRSKIDETLQMSLGGQCDIADFDMLGSYKVLKNED